MKTRADWVLLALHFAGKKGLTPAQLQKTLFVMQKSFPKGKKLAYDFQPYNYGPFDADVYKDAEILVGNGLVGMRYRNGLNWGSYHITSRGNKEAAELISSKDEVQQHLERVVSWAQSLSFQDLIAAIYKKYPEYKINSIFRGA